MSRPLCRRVRWALLCLLSCALGTSAWMLRDMVRRAPAGRNQKNLSDWEDGRFGAIRPLLPAHGTVGYVAGAGDGPAPLYHTQYALAPLVVVADSNRDLVVGTFVPATEPPPPPSPRHEVLVADRERGVICWKAK